MPDLNITKLRDDLARDELLRLKPYKCTAGYLTIGYGRNLEGNGITREEADAMLDHDIRSVSKDLDKNIPWWRQMPEPAQRGLINMAFNLGWPRLKLFANMLAALKSGNYFEAAQHALDSKWSFQVGDRATRIAELFMVSENGQEDDQTS
jgi:lysozyme